jgi:formylglycine-generating enzyme required for sulfatase activity
MNGNCIRVILMVWLAWCRCLPAQNVQITSIAPNGTLTWTQGLSNGIATVEWTTNLSSGPWLPVINVSVTNTICTAEVPVGQPLAGFYRILEADVSQVPTNMALVPAGYFQMGDSYSEVPLEENGANDAQPVHLVYVSSFYADRLDVSNEQMTQVLQWALNNGLIAASSAGVTNLEGQPEQLIDFIAHDGEYSETEMAFSNGLFSILNTSEAGTVTTLSATNLPATAVTWYGAAAYCNYRSDIEGLPRCFNFSNWNCDFTQKGYRLPTEAEWEKASRGGMTGHHYPWQSYGGSYSSFINATCASYSASRDPYEISGYFTTPVGYFNGNQLNYGVPSGTNMINGYGMYDAVGNVWDWCWDGWEVDWYSQAGATQPNTTGPVGSLVKVIRGGSLGYPAAYLVCACRHTGGFDPYFCSELVGVRCVRLPP